LHQNILKIFLPKQTSDRMDAVGLMGLSSHPDSIEYRADITVVKDTYIHHIFPGLRM